MRRIGDDVDLRNLAVFECKRQSAGKLSTGRENCAHLSIDEHRLHEARAVRISHRLLDPNLCSVNRCSGATIHNQMGIEHGEESLNICRAQGRQKCVDGFALLGELCGFGVRRTLHATTDATGQLARGLGRTANDSADFLERQGEDVVQHKREAFGRREPVEHHVVVRHLASFSRVRFGLDLAPVMFSRFKSSSSDERTSLYVTGRDRNLQARMKQPVIVLPEAMNAMQALSAACQNGSVPELTQGLVHLRASQINGCSLCVDMHPRLMRKGGETEERLMAVSAWREMPYFSDAERAALELTECVTRLSDKADPVPDAVWAEAARHYDEKALATLLLSIAAINVWNRLNVATRQIPGTIKWVQK